MSWLEDGLRKRKEHEEERRRQAEELQRLGEERRRQEQEVVWRREQEERLLQEQRQQQLDQMAWAQVEPILNSIQVRQLLQDTNRSWPGIYDSWMEAAVRSRSGRGSLGGKKSSLGEDFHGEGNASMLNEPLCLTGWNYSLWVTFIYYTSGGDSAQEVSWTDEHSYTLRFRLMQDTLTQTRIAVEEENLSIPTWEEEITFSNASKVVAQLKDSVVQAILKLEELVRRHYW